VLLSAVTSVLCLVYHDLICNNQERIQSRNLLFSTTYMLLFYVKKIIIIIITTTMMVTMVMLRDGQFSFRCSGHLNNV
jgi:hypothetical protein